MDSAIFGKPVRVEVDPESKTTMTVMAGGGVPKQTTRAVESVALATATAQAKPSLYSRKMLKLYLILAVPFLISCSNGYNGGVMGGINSYPAYREYFGFDPDAGTPYNGIVFAIYNIGGLAASPFSGPLADWKGRKWAIFIAGLMISIFSIVAATSTTLTQFMAARFMMGFSNSLTNAAPIYVLEMAHPSFRGIIGGFYNVWADVGGAACTFIPYGTSRLAGDASWRIPLWCQMMFSGLVVLTAPFIPESPRWLIANNRHEEALNTMAEYHGEGDRESPIVQLEYKEMMEHISTSGSDKRWWDYSGLFNTREMRYRSMLIVSFGFIGQWAGNASATYYYSSMLEGTGVQGHLATLLQGIQTIISIGGAVIGCIYADAWGRRKQLIGSTSLIIVIFAILISLVSTNDLYGDGSKTHQPQAIAAIAMTWIFGFTFSVGFTPLQVMYPIECMRYETRGKGMALLNVAISAAIFYNTFTTGIAFAHIAWRYYFVFIGWNICAIAFMYYFFVETRRRTLEELTEIFRSRYPVRTSLARSPIVISGDEIVIHEVDKTYE